MGFANSVGNFPHANEQKSKYSSGRNQLIQNPSLAVTIDFLFTRLIGSSGGQLLAERPAKGHIFTK